MLLIDKINLYAILYIDYNFFYYVVLTIINTTSQKINNLILQLFNFY